MVAETIDQANDAAEALDIEWNALPHVIGGVEALAKGAPSVWSDIPGNQAFDFTLGDKGKTDAAFAKAAKVVTVDLVNQRIVANYMDTRGAICEYDAAKDRYTMWVSSQGSHTAASR